MKQQSQEEKEVARSILFSHAAESAIDVDADQLLNASTQREEPAQTGTHQDWNPTPREGAASQSSQQTEPPSQAVNSAVAIKTSQENSSPHSTAKTGKRLRNAPKTKTPAAKERDEQPLPDVAEATPPVRPKSSPALVAILKKQKNTEQTKHPQLDSRTWMNLSPEPKGASCEKPQKGKDVPCLQAEYRGRVAAAASVGRLPAASTNSCNLPSGSSANFGSQTA